MADNAPASPTAHAADPAAAAKNAAVAQIATDLMTQFSTIEAAYEEMVSLFKSQGLDKEVKFFEAKLKQVGNMSGWYDPRARTKARIDKLRDQLAKLEAEAEAEENAA